MTLQPRAPTHAFALGFAAAVLLAVGPAAAQDMAIVTKEQPGHASADKKAPEVVQYEKGERVTVVTKDGKWAQVRNHAGVAGFLPAKMLKGTENVTLVGTATKSVYTFAQPKTKSEKSFKVSEGDQVTIVAERGKWVLVANAAHERGWTLAKFFAVSKQAPAPGAKPPSSGPVPPPMPVGMPTGAAAPMGPSGEVMNEYTEAGYTP